MDNRLQRVSVSTDNAVPQMRNAWDRFLSDRDEPSEVVRPLVRDSWLRCRTQGVDPHLSAAPIVLERSQAHDVWKRSLLCDAALPVLQLLQQALEGHSFLISVSDAECCVLETIADPKSRAAAESVNSAPGAQWTEDRIGTQASGVARVLDAPVQIYWYEHYCEVLHTWTCNAAPIHNALTRDLVGILGLHGVKELAHPKSLDLLIHCAGLIERNLHDRYSLQRLLLYERYHTYRNRFPGDFLLCLDPLGSILMASDPRPLLSMPLEQVVGRNLRKLPGSEFHDLALTWTGDESSYDLVVDTAAKRALKVTVIPIVRSLELLGFILLVRGVNRQARGTREGSPWRAFYAFDDLVGEDKAFSDCVADARKVAREDVPVLIIGESGTGKELFAHAIHNSSRRREGPFIPINCGGMNEELLSAELFGYVDGAFTGAARGGRPGKLELAHNGTLLLDEAENMSAKMQAHLLRALEHSEVVRIGASRPCAIDTRIIAATNVDLESRVAAGLFRNDLYYRISVLTLTLPPLRERKGDIPILVRRILQDIGWHGRIEPEAVSALQAYSWPGNVRELKNVLLRATVRAVKDTITREDLLGIASPPKPTPLPKGNANPASLPLTSLEKEAIFEVLKRANGNISRAARELGIHRVTLYRKLKKYGHGAGALDPPLRREEPYRFS